MVFQAKTQAEIFSNELTPRLLYLYCSLFLVAPFTAAKKYYHHVEKETDRYGIFYRNSYGQKGRCQQTAKNVPIRFDHLRWSKVIRVQGIYRVTMVVRD